MQNVQRAPARCGRDAGIFVVLRQPRLCGFYVPHPKSFTDQRAASVKRLIAKAMGGFDMFFIIPGAALVAGSSAAYWYLLPTNGQVNPLVENSDVGSMITIAIMSLDVIGIALLFDGLFG